MGRQNRGEVIDPTKVQVLHCIHRCVRRAFLCGQDPLTGRSFAHRREWIRHRLEFLASIFGIECVTYTVMENHLHLILRSRPDIVAQWSDRQVATRWLRLFPERREKDGSPAVPSRAEIDSIVNDPQALAARRRRLSDISWWMRCTAENIARRSNREDEVTGHFWEGRFRSQLLLDEASLLACAMYVDLNPVRAAMAATPETSLYTGVKDRLDDLAHRSGRSRMSDHQWERSRQRRHSGWLCPVEIDERNDPLGGAPSQHDRRASDQGILPLSLSSYLQLLDWTGRQIRAGRRGKIPSHLSPILQRIGLDPSNWCDLVSQFGRRFRRAAGRPATMQAEARRRGQRWLQCSAALV